MLSFEGKHEKLIDRQRFRQRLAFNGLIALAIVVFALAVGMAGYMYLDDRSAVDAFESSAMILSGMGPVGDIPEDHVAAKIFAGVYAIVCGLLIFAVAGIVLAPVFHRLLHRFHVSSEDDERG